MSLADLAGLITVEVGETLADLAAEVPAERAIVEIGSFKGKSTCYLAAGAAGGQGAHVWAVDPWDTPGNPSGRFGFAEAATRADFERQVAAAGASERITAIQGFSVDVAAGWEGPEVGLLYVDGDHSAKGVRADFRAWEPHLAAGAVVAFDDLDTPKNPGVRVVIEELTGELGPWRIQGRLAIGRRRG